MEGSHNSPSLKKVVGEVLGKRKRGFDAPTEVYLEDWWLSKPKDGKGIAVQGRPVEMRRCNNTLKEFHSAPPTRKIYASRELKFAKVAVRHDLNEIETSDGCFVYLCGPINRSRTKQNGFSSEVCNAFSIGFPYDWESYGAECEAQESSQRDLEYFANSFLPAAMETYNFAELHDMILHLTDVEREIFNQKMYDNIMAELNPSTLSETTPQPSEPSPSSPISEMS